LMLGFSFNKNSNNYLIFGGQGNLTSTRQVSRETKWTLLNKYSFIDSGLVKFYYSISVNAESEATPYRPGSRYSTVQCSTVSLVNYGHVV
jgi:hypothetical protein